VFLSSEDNTDRSLPVHEALSQYYDLYGDMLYGLLQKLCNNDHEKSEILLMGIFIKINSSLHREVQRNEKIFIRILRIAIRYLRENGIDPIPAIRKSL
jgi:hypothetical protein